VALRQKGYKGHITGGGHFGTFACKEILRDFPEIDSICLHEAEKTLASLARVLAAGDSLVQIPGLACRDDNCNIVSTVLPAPLELDALPWPDRRGTPEHYMGHNAAPLVSSRGCYANCTFCCISAWHEQTLPGKRFRLRSIEDVADEMAWLYRNRKIEIFIFHDDNFFLPDRGQTLRRINSLADMLAQREVGNYATVAKARPDDLDREVVQAMQERLGLIRLYLGVETNADNGLRTLGRRVSSAQNRDAVNLLRRKSVYCCFNMLIFDPSTTIDDLEANLAFMEKFADVPQNFGRVELYAGTPLLADMQKNGRCSGDYSEWDYRMADNDVQRIFELAMRCFYERNFSEEAAPHRLMGTRFCAEAAARFHRDVYSKWSLETLILWSYR
jgi:anaerobic magnesium-protoporphyrin IX monomethyl ester cyclase